MDAEQRSELMALHRGLAILQVAGHRCPSAANSPAHAELREVVDEIMRAEAGRHAVRQERGASAERKRRLRGDLSRRHIGPIIAAIGAYPKDFSAISKAQGPGPRARDDDFVVRCHALLSMADAHAMQFVKHGLPADFVDAMRLGVAELEELVLRVNVAPVLSFGKRERVRVNLARSRKLKKMLTALVNATPDLDPELERAWRAAMLHAPRPAHRLAGGKRAPALTAGPAAAVKLLAASTEERTKSDSAAPRASGGAIARIAAKARLLLPSGKKSSGAAPTSEVR